MPADLSIEHFADDQIVETPVATNFSNEIQSVKFHNNILAAVDSYSNVQLYNVQNSTSQSFRYIYHIFILTFQRCLTL